MLSFDEFIQIQLRQALGPENKWFCSEFYGREITDPDTLLAYYIKHGGAEACRRLYPPAAAEGAGFGEARPDRAEVAA